MPDLATIHPLVLVVVNILRSAYAQPRLYVGALNFLTDLRSDSVEYRSADGRALATTLVRQHLFPFVAIMRSLLSRAAVSSTSS